MGEARKGIIRYRGESIGVCRISGYRQGGGVMHGLVSSKRMVVFVIGNGRTAIA